jgi:hypothetical protein
VRELKSLKIPAIDLASLVGSSRSDRFGWAELPTATAARLPGAAEAVWENMISAIEAVIFQQIFLMPLLVRLTARRFG